MRLWIAGAIVLLCVGCSSDDQALDAHTAINDAGVSDAYTVEDAQAPDADVDATAAYQLTVMKLGTGSGIVTSDVAGIDCGSGCSAEYATGAMVRLTAVADGDSDFVGWGGDCSGTGACVVSMTTARTVTATFSVQQHTLFVIPAGTGTGTVISAPMGIDCGSGCSAAYDKGTSVILIPTPDDGSYFTGWAGEGCTGVGACAVSMTADRAVTATFTLRQHQLTVTPTGAGVGTVTSVPTGINCGATCSANYDHGTSVTLSATPAPGSDFAGWTGEGCTGTGVCVVSITQARSVTARFDVAQHTLTVSRVGGGTGTVSSLSAGIDCGSTCSADYVHGTMVTLSATPDPGNTFVGWSGSGCTGNGACVVSMVSANSVTAVFGSPSTCSVAPTSSLKALYCDAASGIQIMDIWNIDAPAGDYTLSVTPNMSSPTASVIELYQGPTLLQQVNYNWQTTISAASPATHHLAGYLSVSVGRCTSGTSSEYGLGNIFDGVKVLRISCP